jgi:hypothetical protein
MRLDPDAYSNFKSELQYYHLARSYCNIDVVIWLDDSMGLHICCYHLARC